MFGVIVLSFYAGKRTVKYIKDFLEKTNAQPKAIVVVDNSRSQENYCLIEAELIKLGANGTTDNIICKTEYEIDESKKYIYINCPIILIHSAKNLGYAKGNNLGFDILRCNYDIKYALISNDDVLFPDEVFDMRHLIADFELDNRMGVLGPNVIGLDNVKQSPCDFLTIEERMIYPYLKYPLQRWFPLRKKEIIETDLSCVVYRLIGAFMIVDADKFDECGKFDKNIFVYAEELVLAEQMLKRNYFTYYDPSVTIIHEEGMSSGTDAKSYIRNMKRWHKSNLYYYKQYIGVPKYKLCIAEFSMHFFIFKTRIALILKRMFGVNSIK